MAAGYKIAPARVETVDTLNDLRYRTAMFRICSKIRLLPTPSQETVLLQTLNVCCDVYNSLLNWRELAWQTEQRHVSRYDQQAALPIWKRKQDTEGCLLHPELKTVFSQVLQDVVHRVDLAYSAFFDRLNDYNERNAGGRVREGEAPPGKPRSKGRGHYDSISYTQAGFSIGGNSVSLSKIGDIKAIVHRQIEGTLKTCIVRRYRDKWYACLCYEVEGEPLPDSQENVGIDVGLKTFAALSNGEFIENPRFFRTDRKVLAKAQRKVDGLKHKRDVLSKARLRKARKVVARIHERIRDRRHDFIHQTARRIVNRFGFIFVEKLHIANMSKRPKPKQDETTGEYLPNGASRKAGLNKSILDAAWGFFRNVLSAKAVRAARVYGEVNPYGTSQICSACGGRVPKALKERVHYCPNCGLVMDRDTNSAIYIEAVGQHSLVGVPT